MNKFLKTKMLIPILLVSITACSNDAPKDDVVLVPNEGPTTGEVVIDKLTPKEEPTVEEELIEDGFVEEPTEEIPLEGPEPSTEDYSMSIKTIKSCDDLVHSITKNVPKTNTPFNLKSTYEKGTNDVSKVTVGFESLDAQNKRTAYVGTCKFDSEGNLLSFSAEPIK